MLEEYLKNFTPPEKCQKNGTLGVLCTCLPNGNLRFNFNGNFNNQFKYASEVYFHFLSQGLNVNIKPQNQNWLVVYVNINDIDQAQNEL